MNTAHTLIGIDYGLKRIGIAIGNTLTQHAEPLEIIPNTSFPSVLSRLQRLIQEWQVNALVLGLPRHPDDTPHAMTQACVDFHTQLSQAVSLPIHWVDERYSSAVLPNHSRKNARGQTRAVTQDDRAAAVILQQYLDGLTHST